MRASAIILAAGLGSRLLPHTNEISKCLIDISGKSILARQLQTLNSYGINQITIVVGYMKDTVISHALSALPDAKFQFVVNENFAKTNTLYSLALAAENLGPADNIIQLNGDVVFKPEIMKRLINSEINKSFSTVQKKTCGPEEMKYKLHSDGYISEINKTMEPRNSCGESIGINKFGRETWKNLAKHLSAMKQTHMEKYFENAIQESVYDGAKIFPFEISQSDAIEIDFEDDLAKAKLMKFTAIA